MCGTSSDSSTISWEVDGPLAEELHQEVWLKALEGFEHFDSRRGSFRDWLLGIARHQVSRHHRRFLRDSTRNGARSRLMKSTPEPCPHPS